MNKQMKAELKCIVFEAMNEFREAEINKKQTNVLFTDFLTTWLEIHKLEVAITTYQFYKEIIDSYIVPYFTPFNLTLDKVQPLDIEKYYMQMSKRGLANNTIIKHHVTLFSVFKYACQKDIITNNPVEKVVRPQKEKFIASYYTVSEMHKLLDFLGGYRKMLTPVMLACLLGLRRGEILALQWENIDFKNNSVKICSSVYIDKITRETIVTNKLKSKSSYRMLKMPQGLAQHLKEIKAEQEKNVLEKKYETYDYIDFVCLDEKGCTLRPDYLSGTFPRLLENHGFRKIRFHDLRHSCATMLMVLDCSLKEIQGWLGHADITTTADTYLHLDFSSKERLSEKIDSVVF